RSRNAREKIPTKKEISQDEAPVKDEMPEIVYTMEDLDREYAESMEEMARGECFSCATKEELFEHLRDLENEVNLEMKMEKSNGVAREDL
ncbi:MAG: hypothetical protein LBI61_02790, partial [Puniceicoccales bacterium]|nr:hypothetical protein [Puniceicoccales bacterium]